MQTRLLKNAGEVLGLLESFHCGNEEIDKYFREDAIHDDDAVTYCFLDDNLKTIIALSSLSCNGIIIKSGNLYHTLPAVEIKMFAVNERFKHTECPFLKGYNWSDYCFDKTVSNIYEFTENFCGAARILLYSVPKAKHFYKRQKMEDFTDLMHGDDRQYLRGCIPMLMVL